jgi:DNA-binding GntR family transcriptional regulator
MAKLPSTNRSRLVDEILEYVREQIYSGEFPAGMQLRQERLAEELDVSRTPLREALRVLQSEGLLQMKRGNRVEVIGADVERFLDALVLRELVDGVAARLSAERQTPRLGASLQRALEAQHAALDPWDRPAFANWDVEFHRAIFAATGNPYVIAQLSLVRLSIQIFQRGTSWGQERAARTIADHERIAEKILADEPADAEEVSRLHIHRVIDDLRAQQSTHS